MVKLFKSDPTSESNTYLLMSVNTLLSIWSNGKISEDVVVFVHSRGTNLAHLELTGKAGLRCFYLQTSSELLKCYSPFLPVRRA